MGRPTSGIAWEPHTMGGEVYCLDHLHPWQWAVTIPSKPPSPERLLLLAVSYSLHCFTRQAAPGEVVPDDGWYADSRERRVFDPRRWALSKRLPEIIASLESRRCLHSGREEFLTVEVIEEGRRFDYVMFFTVTKSGKGKGADLNLFINSAHERTDAIRYKKPVRLHFILLNRYLGKPLHAPP